MVKPRTPEPKGGAAAQLNRRPTSQAASASPRGLVWKMSGDRQVAQDETVAVTYPQAANASLQIVWRQDRCSSPAAYLAPTARSWPRGFMSRAAGPTWKAPPPVRSRRGGHHGGATTQPVPPRAPRSSPAAPATHIAAAQPRPW